MKAAWASRLNAVLSVLFAVSQSVDGAVLLAENRCFALLAYCPLLHVAILPPNAPGVAGCTASSYGQFPAPYSWPLAGSAYQGTIASTAPKKNNKNN